MNISKARYINVYLLLFYSGFLLLQINKFAKIISIMTGSWFASGAAYLLGIALISLYILVRGFSIADALLLVYAVFSYIYVRDTTMCSLLVLLIAVKGLNTDNVIHLYAVFQTLVLTACIMLYSMFLLLGSSYAITSWIGGRLRYNFFFAHPNNFAIQCVFTFFAWLYLYREKIPYWLMNLLTIALATFIYIFPNSQTAVIALLVFLIAQFMIRYFRKIWRPFIKALLPITLVVVIILVYMFYTGNISFISNFIIGTFASRFEGAATAFSLYDINLFGNYMSQIGSTVLYSNGQWGSFWLDLAYVRMPFAFGIVGSLIFYGIVIKGIARLIHRRNYYILTLFAVIIAYALSEWTAFSVVTVFPLLFLSDALNDSQKKRIKVVFPVKS